MAIYEINLSNGSYKHKSLPLSAQRTINFWPQTQSDGSARSPAILEGFHGLKLFGTVSGTSDRGMLEHKGALYKVTDTALYSVDLNGSHTSLGTIPGSDRCIMEGIGNSVVLTTEGKAYIYNGTTLSEITDPDLETPNTCAHLNNQIIYDGDGGRFAVSDVGDAATINGLNYATAESDADDLVRVYAFNQLLYLFGEKSIETWFNTGSGNPPFERVEGGIVRVGLGAIHSVANTPDLIFFFGSDGQIYGMSGSTADVISTKAIAREISNFGTVSDAHGRAINIDGQWLYVLTFVNGNRTFIYEVDGGEWFEWSSGVSQGRHYSSSYAFAFRKHLVGDERNGNIYELDPDTYTDNGDAIVRVRDTGVIHGALFGAPGKKIWMNSFELIMETGAGIIGSGQGSDPRVILQYSDDGGRTWSTERWATIGKLGEFEWRVRWFNLGSFMNRIMRIKTSDPVYFSIHSSQADLEMGI